MLLFILIYLREAPKQVLFGVLFGMSQPLANRWIHLLGPILNKALAELGELPSRGTDPAPICAPSFAASVSKSKKSVNSSNLFKTIGPCQFLDVKPNLKCKRSINSL